MTSVLRHGSLDCKWQFRSFRTQKTLQKGDWLNRDRQNFDPKRSRVWKTLSGLHLNITPLLNSKWLKGNKGLPQVCQDSLNFACKSSLEKSSKLHIPCMTISWWWIPWYKGSNLPSKRTCRPGKKQHFNKPPSGWFKSWPFYTWTLEVT